MDSCSFIFMSLIILVCFLLWRVKRLAAVWKLRWGGKGLRHHSSTAYKTGWKIKISGSWFHEVFLGVHFRYHIYILVVCFETFLPWSWWASGFQTLPWCWLNSFCFVLFLNILFAYRFSCTHSWKLASANTQSYLLATWSSSSLGAVGD